MSLDQPRSTRLPAPTRMVALLLDDNIFHQQCPRAHLADEADRHGVELAVVGRREALSEFLRDAEVFVGNEVPPGVVAAAPNLAWIHAVAAGVERIMVPEVLASAIRVTSSAGTMAPEVGEHALALILAMTRRIDRSIRAQCSRGWAPIRREHPPVGLEGLTLGIAGYGHIGREIAARARAFGMRIVGMRRHAAEPDGLAHRIIGRDGFADLLAEADIVVAALPATPATQGLFNSDAFEAMGRDAWFINVGRGAAVDEAALARALDDGVIAGAASDVFVAEPLPCDSPLWTAPNLIISPHLAGGSQHVWTRVIALLFDNLERCRRGETLLNEVAKHKGY